MPETLVIVKKSPDCAFSIVIPIEGKKAVVEPPRTEVPVKKGEPKVIALPDDDVPHQCGAVDDPLPV